MTLVKQTKCFAADPSSSQCDSRVYTKMCVDRKSVVGENNSRDGKARLTEKQIRKFEKFRDAIISEEVLRARQRGLR